MQVPGVRSVMSALVAPVGRFEGMLFAVQIVGVVEATVAVRLGLVAVALDVAGTVKLTGAGVMVLMTLVGMVAKVMV